ncbi:MAG: YkgJ family cysteine cluster protein [Halobacteriales archaeon]|nr:YkgJ family cysteine cluster protein [Halobacteriales archaeon]
MEVDCEGCAGCCVDWRPLIEEASDHERRGPRRPVDDVYNLVPLSRDDARGFLEAGLADALTPRLWYDDDGIEIDGHRIAALEGKPAFFLGIRKPPKPVGPFDVDPAWLPTCAFLDPETLQCRIHDADIYPEECAEYPGHNLELGAETECERVEASFGGDRLLEASPPDDLSTMLLGPQAVGQKIFVHPDPDRLTGVVQRAVDGTLTQADRAEFVAAATAGAPGTTETNMDAFASARETARTAESWVGQAIDEWTARREDTEPDPSLGTVIEEQRGAPSTPGWKR